MRCRPRRRSRCRSTTCRAAGCWRPRTWPWRRCTPIRPAARSSCPPNTGRKILVRATVDPGNRVQESNERNNTTASKH
ncbi:MAG: hypothetical protein CMJ58_26020 [Planctomycetaceae bacterium]|nr:hypothetical protein [Planctomycetaceae bacterium]